METAWNKYKGKKIKEVMDFCEEYKEFISNSKTEREFTKNTIELVKKDGFKDLETVKKVKAGDKLYFNNHGKSLVLFVVGKNPTVDGMNVVGSHIDSPRLDLKPHPVYESAGLVLLDTHYYGGIKKYQWVTHPLALHGTVCKKDGTSVDIVIGEKDSDPVLVISDLLIHLSANQLQKNAATVIEGEQLDVLVGSIPSTKEDEKDPVKANIMSILKKEYGIEEDDFVSAELEIVPAGKARDLGLDKSMVLAYGHDDRICAYPSVKAVMNLKNPARTTCCILTDKEEVGSQGNTGAQSDMFEYATALLLDKLGVYSDLALKTTMRKSFALSNDVTCAFDPNFPEACEKNNASYFGKGVAIMKYTGARGKSGSNDSNAEYVAMIRNIFDKNDVSWQTGELGKVDQGGGGTIAYLLANLGLNVIDSGVAVLNMHSCWEAASKVDIYETYRAYYAFLKDAK